MQQYSVTTEEDFLKLMEEIDRELRDEGIAIHARPLHGWLRYSSRFNLGLKMVSSGTPREGCYTGDDLSIRIFQWFDRKYGDRLKVDFSPGSTVVVIRGDLYKIKLPFIVASALICSPEHYGKELGQAMVNGTVLPMYNALEAIEEGTQELFNSLTSDELDAICNMFLFGHSVFQTLRAAPRINLVKEAVGDIEATVFNLFTNPPQHGHSKWASLQASEKFIKSYITKQGGTYRNTHNLDELATNAEALGLRPIPRAKLDKIQCSPGVRYGSPLVTLQEAVEAHHAALDICAGIAEVL